METKQKTIQILDKKFTPSISAEKIDAAVQDIANRLNNDLKNKHPLFLGVLNGAFMFAADLFKKVTVDCDISFIKMSSYTGTKTSKQVKELIGLNEDIGGRTVVVIEDIIDTGITLSHIIPWLNGKGAKEVKIACLLYKPDAFIKDFNIDYIGMEIPNDFIVGYGLDYNGKGRNLPEIYTIVD